jgi:hypothetical protein
MYVHVPTGSLPSSLTRCWLLVPLLLLCLSGGSAAQDIQTPESIAVSHTGEDRVGNALIYEYREEINSSSQMELEASAGADNSVRLSLVTLDPDEGQRLEGTSTIYSATWTYLVTDGSSTVELHLTSQVGFCGKDRVQSTARSLAAETDEQRRRVPGEILELALLVEPSTDDEEGR